MIDVIPHLPSLRRWAHKLTKSADIDDLVQDTVARALAKQHTFQQGTNLRAWLMTVMHNTFINDRRGATRMEAKHACCPSSAISPPEQIAHMRILDLSRALAGINSQRNVRALMLIAYHGKTYADAAAELNIPTTTLRSALMHTRAALRRAEV